MTIAYMDSYIARLRHTHDTAEIARILKASEADVYNRIEPIKAAERKSTAIAKDREFKPRHHLRRPVVHHLQPDVTPPSLGDPAPGRSALDRKRAGEAV